MPLKDSLKALTHLVDTSILVRIILALWLISSLFTFTMLHRIDSIIHDKMYDYGLQFNLSWANPYWTAHRLIYVFLAIPLALSVAVLSHDLYIWKSNNKKQTSKPRPESAETQNIRISCPSCKRVFSRPLVLLQYPNGKAKLVNACPYCSAILKGVDQKEHVETRVLENRASECAGNHRKR